MTDFRDMHRTAYGQTDPNRYNDVYDARSGGTTGVLIAIGVIALLIVAALIFGGGESETTAITDGAQTAAPTAPVEPAMPNPAAE